MGNRRGPVFSMRISPAERERIEAFARKGDVPSSLFNWGGRVRLGPFLVWCAHELERMTKAKGKGKR